MENRSGNKERIVFKEVFGLKKAKLEAKEYCQKLDKGEDKVSISNNYWYSLQEKVDKDIISKREREARFFVKININYLAQDIYCPKHRDYYQIPSNERFKIFGKNIDFN